jgi:antitoxin HicB
VPLEPPKYTSRGQRALENLLRRQALPPVWYISHVLRRIPIAFSPQPEGGYTVTSPILPELITEGDTLEEAYANVSDALAAVIELYEEQGRALP